MKKKKNLFLNFIFKSGELFLDIVKQFLKEIVLGSCIIVFLMFFNSAFFLAKNIETNLQQFWYSVHYAKVEN